MSSDIFDGQILAEKLSKLNNSQQSIESLSRWCISHRKKARQIVETWEKIFDASQKERRVSFLYLANDILQNSRRKGNEFVNEFWKALPAALKHVYENGDENGRKVVTRLVGIWEERKVFGSRGQSLKDDMLGKDPPPPLSSNGKSSNSSPNPSTNHNPNPNPIKIVKRDAQSVRIKLAVGGLPERIVTAFQSVLDEHFDEEAALNKYNDALLHVGKIRKDVENTSHLGNQSVSLLVDELQEQGNMLQQCVAELEGAEATRAKLISQLKEALQEQESKQEMIRTQLQMARHQIEEFSTLRERLTSPTVPGHSIAVNVTVPDAIRAVEQTQSPIQPGTTTSQPPLMPTNVSSYAPLKPTDEESKKAAAAAVAAKLAASTSSAQMLTSVLSSLVAEEALNSSFKSAGFTSGLPLFPPEKRPKLDMPIPVSDIGTSSTGGRSYFTPLEQQSGTSMPLVPPSTAMRSESQSSQLQAPFGSLPPLPPPSHLSTSIPQTNQFVQSTGMMVGTMPYSYGGNTLPPPPPLPPHVAMGLARPGPQPSQLSQPSQQSQQQQQSPATGGYYRPLGIGFFGPNNQAAPPPVPRQ